MQYCTKIIYKKNPEQTEPFAHARSLTHALGGLGKRVVGYVMCWLLACRPRRGCGSHNVRAEHQLAVRGPDGIYLSIYMPDILLLLCVPSPAPIESRARYLTVGAVGGQA